jgi:hypothetical protein
MHLPNVAHLSPIVHRWSAICSALAYQKVGRTSAVAHYRSAMAEAECGPLSAWVTPRLEPDDPSADVNFETVSRIF